VVKRGRAIWALATLALCACGRPLVETKSSALACSEVDASATCTDKTLTYETVKPIITRSCLPCHADETDGNWPLLTYREIADWSDVISSDVIGCTMPPSDQGISLSAQDRTTLVNWFVCGNPQ
jgi:hypothetical protein